MTTTQMRQRIGVGMRSTQSWVQLLKFGIVGGSGYVINLAVFAFAVEDLGAHRALAAVVAFCVAVSNNFFWNRNWTFRGTGGPAAFQAVRFLGVSLAALAVNLVMLELLVSAAGVGELPAQAIAVATAMPFSFLGNKLWAFA